MRYWVWILTYHREQGCFTVVAEFNVIISDIASKSILYETCKYVVNMSIRPNS